MQVSNQNIAAAVARTSSPSNKPVIRLSPTANADNLYNRQIISRRVQHAYFTLHYTFFEAPGSTFPGTSP